MKQSTLTLLSAALTIVALGCGPSAAPPVAMASATETAVATPAPETLVTELYDQHARSESPFFQTKSRALVDKYFEASLGDLIWKDAVTSSGEVGALEFDPLYDAQDTDIKNFAIHPGTIEGDRASVLVTFENHGEKKQLTYALARLGEVWKITDISFGEGRTLRAVFSGNPPQSETATSGTTSGGNT
ncbi:MAG: DUF3828 domain-containing protein [Acidobacteriota bacterium]